MVIALQLVKLEGSEAPLRQELATKGHELERWVSHWLPHMCCLAGNCFMARR
jgi:hypothetical protein